MSPHVQPENGGGICGGPTQESTRQRAEEGAQLAFPRRGASRPAETPHQSACTGEAPVQPGAACGTRPSGACADRRLLGSQLPGRWLSVGPGADPDRRTDSLSLTVDFRILQSVGSPGFVFWTKLNTLASNCLLFRYRWDMIY